MTLTFTPARTRMLSLGSAPHATSSIPKLLRECAAPTRLAFDSMSAQTCRCGRYIVTQTPLLVHFTSDPPYKIC